MTTKIRHDAASVFQRLRVIQLTLVLAIAATAISPVFGESLNGFDVSNALVPTSQIIASGVLKDGIPALDNPKFTKPGAADYLQDEDMVVSVTIAEETRAYPLRILDHHEVVNDQIGENKFVVTYCPLCGTAMVFNRWIGNRALSFGVSGLLYQSDVLLYDRETESLWSQLGLNCIAGSQVNTGLNRLPSEQMTWAAWKRQHPTGAVLSLDTGHRRDYSKTPYADYESSPDLLFPVPLLRTELPVKARVIGVFIGNGVKAYPIKRLTSETVLSDTINGFAIELRYDPASRQATVIDLSTGTVAPSVQAYWFAWQSFYPKTELWRP